MAVEWTVSRILQAWVESRECTRGVFPHNEAMDKAVVRDRGGGP